MISFLPAMLREKKKLAANNFGGKARLSSAQLPTFQLLRGNTPQEPSPTIHISDPIHYLLQDSHSCVRGIWGDRTSQLNFEKHQARFSSGGARCPYRSSFGGAQRLYVGLSVRFGNTRLE